MPGWTRRAVGDLPIYQSSTLAWLPGVVQGFTTRHGGVSLPPFDSLNLGAHVGDCPEAVQANRQSLWNDLGVQPSQVAFAEQVHGSRIAVVTSGEGQIASGADAIVTDKTNIFLMLFFADCVPVYVVDPVVRAVALIHSGWRGTVGGIVLRAVEALQENYGSRPGSCLAAIGPCIGGESYEVGPEVAEQFHRLNSLRFATAVVPRNEFAGTYNLNLRQVIYSQLLSAGLRAEYVSVSAEDTFRNRRDFYSFRRDGAATGRMAGFLALRSI